MQALLVHNEQPYPGNHTSQVGRGWLDLQCGSRLLNQCMGGRGRSHGPQVGSQCCGLCGGLRRAAAGMLAAWLPCLALMLVFAARVCSLKGHGHWVNTMSLSTDYALRTGAFDHTGAAPADADAAKAAAQARYDAARGGRPERLATGASAQLLQGVSTDLLSGIRFFYCVFTIVFLCSCSCRVCRLSMYCLPALPPATAVQAATTSRCSCGSLPHRSSRWRA